MAVSVPAVGPDFSERDRALLTLLRPHLYQAHLDAERRRASVSCLTPRQSDRLPLVAAGHTNAQIARRLGVAEGMCGRIWKGFMPGCMSPAGPRRCCAPFLIGSDTRDRYKK